MGISRRGFLERSTITAAALATAGVRSIAWAEDGTTAPTQPDVIARLTLDDAKFFVGSVFTVHASLQFLCVQVAATSQQETTAPNQAFAMRFLPQKPTTLKQGTYAFQHPVLGRFRLFIVPSGPGVTPRYYTAIINHSTS